MNKRTLTVSGRPYVQRESPRATRSRPIGTLGLLVLLSTTSFGRADDATLNAAADTFISSSGPTNNAGGHAWFDAGTDGPNGGNAVRRGLVRFDLSSIPTGSTITSAVVRLTVTKVPGFGPVDSTFDLNRLLADWAEGTNVGNNGSLATPGQATWNSRILDTADWTAPGAASDAAATASASATVGATIGEIVVWSGPGLVSDVQVWLDDPAQNFGWLLTSQAEVTGKSVRGFGSRESTNTGTLEIGYTPLIITDPIAERVPKGTIAVELQTVADGMAAPLGMAVPDDGSGRLFVYDQDGRIWNVTAGGRESTPLLDLRGRLVLLGAYDERGLLGVAAHPNFAENPFLYTYTSEPYAGAANFQNGLDTTNNHQSMIAEWRMSASNTNLVDPDSRREILRIDQPQANHNGGVMHFGPDGQLYIALGDGGQANDDAIGHVPGGNAQDINRIWGKLLRLDVDGRTSGNGQYAVLEDNPFVGTNGLDEIWAYGFRNVISFSFERGTGALYLADVGQNKLEEINLITKGGNYGWNIREGTFWFDGAGNIVSQPVRPVPPDLIDPIAQYDHDDGLAVIGGFAYHGSAVPDLAGRFVFGDWGSFAAPSGRLFYLDETNGVRELRLGSEDRPPGLWLRGFGEDADGELYVFCSRQLGPSGNTGRMLKIIPAPAPLQLVSVTPEGGTNLDVVWSGGTGPYALQKRAAVADPIWVNVEVTEAHNADTTPEGSAGFLRVLDAAHEPPVPLTVYLTGAGARPTSNNSAGLGTGILRVDGDTLSFDIAYRNLGTTAVAAHIHGPAEADEGAGVVINLSAFNGGSWGTEGTLSGVLLLDPSQKAMILKGRTYVNIHTTDFPGGEIAGQIAPVNMQASLSGANQEPPTATAATGLGNLTLVGTQLTFNVTYRSLSGPAVAAHIHSGLTGDPLVDLAPYHRGAFGTAGGFSGTVTFTPEQLALLVDGETYLNVHTAENPGGEIRGTIVPHVTGTPLTALLSGLAVKPTPLTNTASATGTFSLEADTLTFNLAYSDLSGPATAAHIHGPANTTGNAGVWIDLAPFNGGAWGDSGTVSGTVTLAAERRNALLNGRTYVNFHTAANPGGEMRGQIAPVSMFASLSGNNQRNAPVATPATGSGNFALVRDQLSLNLTYRDLLSPAVASHIHGPAGFFQNGGVLAPLDSLNGGAYGVSGSLAGAVSLVTSNLLSLIDGSTYLNFHTTNNPAGEMRGQIMR